MDEESSDSDHRNKRRKIGQMRQSNYSQSSSPAFPAANANMSAANANSFAAKMMAKMGYVEGQGLGATGRGRLAPIETQMRPQGAGLGAVKEKTKQAKEEERREANFRGEVLEDSSEEEKKRRRKLKQKRMSGATSGAGTPMPRPKQKYRTVKEMEAAAEGLEVPNSLKSIIDATGPETRLLTSTAGLMTPNKMVRSETESEKIASRARRDLEAFTNEWTALEERKAFYEAEEIQVSEEVEREVAEYRALENMTDAIQDLQEMTLEKSKDEATESSWERITTRLESMKRLVDERGDISDMREVTVAAIHPLFKCEMLDWDPLQQPRSIVSYLQRLRQVLIAEPETNSTELALRDVISRTRSHSKSTTQYESMIYTLWLPPVRSAIANDWNVYEPDPLIDLITIWRPVLPPFIFGNVVDQLIAQRLTSAVIAWKPRNGQHHRHRNSSKLPHTWLFPWLEYLDDHHTDPRGSTGLLSDVKRKFKTVLSTWDISAPVPDGLDQWRTILQSELSPMLIRYLLPRLALHLSENLIIDPSDQDLTALENVLRWAPFFSLSTMAHLLVAEFFPKWHQTLYAWLTYEGVSYEDVQKWYTWWKDEVVGKDLPTGFNDLAPITAEWNTGIETMSQALDLLENGMDVAVHLPPPTISPPPPPITKTKSLSPTTTSAWLETTHSSERPTINANSNTSKILEAPTTFKDVVEDWCAETGLLLFPLREADLQTGLPLFRITASASGKGGVVVYLKGDVVWARSAAAAGLDSRVFMPMGLDERLIAKAEGR